MSIFVLAIATFLYFAPKIVRATKVKIWLIAQKLNLPAHLNAPEDLPRSLPAGLGPTFDQQNVLAETIVWAVPCISGRGRRIRPNVFGALVATKEEPRKIVFVGPKGRHPTAQTIDLDGMTVLHDSKFLSENLLILPQSGKSPRYLFLFPRSRAGMVEQIVAGLQKRLAEPPARAAMAPPFHEVSAGPG